MIEKELSDKLLAHGYVAMENFRDWSIEAKKLKDELDQLKSQIERKCPYFSPADDCEYVTKTMSLHEETIDKFVIPLQESLAKSEAELKFIHDHYGKEKNENLTKDALYTKIAVLEAEVKTLTEQHKRVLTVFHKYEISDYEAYTSWAEKIRNILQKDNKEVELAESRLAKTAWAEDYSELPLCEEHRLPKFTRHTMLDNQKELWCPMCAIEQYRNRLANAQDVVKDMESNNFNELSEFCFIYTQEMRKALDEPSIKGAFRAYLRCKEPSEQCGKCNFLKQCKELNPQSDFCTNNEVKK